MKALRMLVLPLLAATLLAAPAAAQTRPNKMSRRPATRTAPAATTANSSRNTNSSGKGDNGYAAPGEPVNVQDNGKNTPSYDGPAAGRTATPAKGLALPRKQ